MTEYRKNKDLLRNPVKILVLAVVSAVLIYMIPATNAVLAELTGKDVAAHFMITPLAVSGFGLLIMMCAGNLSFGQTWAENIRLAAAIIGIVALIKCAALLYCSLGKSRNYHNEGHRFPLGGITTFFLRIARILFMLLLGPFYGAFAGALNKLTAEYVDIRGNELSSYASYNLAIGNALLHFAFYAAIVITIITPIGIILAFILLLAIRFIVPYELVSFTAFRMNLTDRSISAKSLLLDIAATGFYLLYISAVNTDIVQNHLFTGPGIENVFPLYLLALLPLILLIYISTSISLSEGKDKTRVYTGSPSFLKKKVQSGNLCIRNS